MRIIRTKRLELRPLSAADRDAVVGILRDGTVKQTYMVPDDIGEEMGDRLFRRLQECCAAEGHYGTGAFFQGELAGFLHDVEIAGGRVEMGYAFHPRWYGRGFATEAFEAVVNELLAQGVEEVLAGAFDTNLASIRVMEKCGMVRLNQEEDIDYRGKTHRCVYYGKRARPKAREAFAMSEENKLDISQVASTNFIDEFVKEDMAPGGRTEGLQVHTRFPPEPNGYLHIGHAKAIYVDFGTAERFGGICNLRMDDTNPTKEDVEYVNAIKEDIHWLGYDWGDRFYYGSDFFEEMYQGAEELICKGLAYVCELTQEQMREMRGDLSTPAKSPYRDRPIEESLDLFRRMRAGEFEDGRMTLRAKIDLASGNFNMRDPVIYRINHTAHHRTGDKWCIYPMYDYAHPFEDAMEHITHSLCSLEFEDHRPFYNWVIENVTLPSKPRQIEFARLGIDHTVMSKRKLRALVEGGYVDGWDDPRMPTLCGLRRRGYTPRAIRNFSVRNGVSKAASTVEYAFLEYCLREDLNETARRAMAVLHPVKLVITNYPAGQSESFMVENNPNCPEDGERAVSFSREIWVEAEDFLPEAAPKFKRLHPGGPECRLKGAYLIKCTGYETDETGRVTEIAAEYDPDSRGGDPADGRKVKGATLHWVDAKTAVDAQVRIYDNLFTVENPEEGNFLDYLDPHSLEVLEGCKVEAALAGARPGESWQFMRQGYFCADSKDSKPGNLVFNRSVKLKDSFKPGK